MAAAKQTTDHEEIKRWVESHGGNPATVKRTRSKRDVGLIRIDFPGFSGEGSLEPISWDEWFSKFDAQGLAFLYQSGRNTNFNKLVRRDADSPRGRATGATGTRRRSARGGRPTRGSSARASQSAASSRGSAASSRGSAASSRGRKVGGKRAARTKVSSGRKPSAGGRRGAAELEMLTKAELYERARSAGVQQRASMNKAQLVRALQHAQ
jgi:hypothetical protein